MNTEKLYYKDAYIKEFDARVVSCTEVSGGFSVVLDKTAFFPEGGGQSSDKGSAGDVRVLDVRERGGNLLHLTDAPLAVGDVVHFTVDFEGRFRKMQMHTAEHILSGLLHSCFGLENTGFHLTDSGVTFDTDRPIGADSLRQIELLANRAVYANVPIRAYFPTEAELEGLVYRSKLELSEGVRIVDIEGIDKCACCAPHVSTTGEVGLIKILYSESHRGGTRIYMLAGEDAFLYIRELAEAAGRASALMSAPVLEIADSVDKLLRAKCELEYKISKKDELISRIFSENIEIGSSCEVVVLPVSEPDALRAFVNMASERCDTVVALSGEENNYRYIIKIKSGDVMPLVKSANIALGGRGGGRGNMAEGRFSAGLSAIKEYFGR